MCRCRLTLSVPRSVHAAMLELAQGHRPNETGGGLLGGWLRLNEAYIYSATAAGQRARGTPATFEPDSKHLQSQAVAAHVSTSGLVTLLGEWHSHPTARRCCLSAVDITTTRLLATEVGISGSILVIVLPDTNRTTLYAWCCRHGHLQRMQVALVT